MTASSYYFDVVSGFSQSRDVRVTWHRLGCETRLHEVATVCVCVCIYRHTHTHRGESFHDILEMKYVHPHYLDVKEVVSRTVSVGLVALFHLSLPSTCKYHRYIILYCSVLTLKMIGFRHVWSWEKEKIARQGFTSYWEALMVICRGREWFICADRYQGSEELINAARAKKARSSCSWKMGFRSLSKTPLSGETHLDQGFITNVKAI